MARSKAVLGVGLAVALALVAVTAFMADQITTTSASDGGPEMRLVVTAGGECVDDKCTVPEGGAFTLAVDVLGFPDGGYYAVQSLIDFGPDLVYNFQTAADEAFWPDREDATCVGDPTAPETHNLRNQGCLTGIVPPFPVSEFAGIVYEMSFNCSEGDSSTEVELLPLGYGGHLSSSGAGFGHGNNQQTPAKVNNITINCGEGGGNGDPSPSPTPGDTEPTPTPGDTEPTATPDTEPTVTPTATTAPPTPTPDDKPCGDVTGDGLVNAIDALFVLQLSANLIQDLPQGVDAGDLNGDGQANAVDAALILQISASLYSC